MQTKISLRRVWYDEVMVEDVNLSIGRSYRKLVKDALKIDLASQGSKVK
jgi:hypothetical protein